MVSTYYHDRFRVRKKGRRRVWIPRDVGVANEFAQVCHPALAPSVLFTMYMCCDAPLPYQIIPNPFTSRSESNNPNPRTLLHNPTNTRSRISTIRITRLERPRLRNLRRAIDKNIPLLGRKPFKIRIQVRHDRLVHIRERILLDKDLRTHARIYT
jgi:hypothetical protein